MSCNPAARYAARAGAPKLGSARPHVRAMSAKPVGGGGGGAMSAKPVGLWRLPQELNDCVYTGLKYPLLVDPSGQAIQFLKYRTRHLSALRKGDFDNESLRRALVQGLHNGAWILLDFDRVDVDLGALFTPDHFPEAVLTPHELFLEETYKPLLRSSDEFTAKVTYEHQAALAQGSFVQPPGPRRFPRLSVNMIIYLHISISLSLSIYIYIYTYIYI